MADGQQSWEAYWLTTLDEGGHIWLWELVGDANNFFPDASREQRVAMAERAARKLLDEGWAHLIGSDGAALDDAETVLRAGAWRTSPPPPENDYELVPTKKWSDWSENARTAGA